MSVRRNVEVTQNVDRTALSQGLRARRHEATNRFTKSLASPFELQDTEFRGGKDDIDGASRCGECRCRSRRWCVCGDPRTCGGLCAERRLSRGVGAGAHGHHLVAQRPRQQGARAIVARWTPCDLPRSSRPRWSDREDRAGVVVQGALATYRGCDSGNGPGALHVRGDVEGDADFDCPSP